MKKNLWSIIFGTDGSKNSSKIIEITKKSSSGESWLVRIGEQVGKEVKQLNK